ncbi:F0F1 ATP synthase subunit epsilon [Desulfosudis oleivorans]|uniref:ATP synthase epsilon chain n=1 Tax=Desulfosudis oleivorans (strain DSM 6200 / JCM 39069 / Hxd3) TaxID=96561 RepID=ATPE_DESOH|nr:F0F1 ATP synthase subunit epsilon [Desulfosudis oleivorans]A8ZUA2.1 RecName: Full=ATP synthase epsilon chain; AltName: Full=ATP synthase F1 sector epsilon subunit; AltName: Full=F-ATPase epsilon subunit [Desulfosudis oleivorans Hxd3]ABW66414.1 ATP synthase F1, epsilon subunit [Desulfosudis oleivorans Hxd3]
MAENLRLEVVTPEKTVVSDDAQIVMAPGVLGEFGVLVNHTPFLTSLMPGALHYKDTGEKEHLLFVSDGFAEVLPDRITVLVESAERKEDIDLQRAEAARERAEKRLESGEDVDFVRAKAALTRAIQRIRVAGA